MTSYVFSVIEKQIIWSKVYDILKSKYEDDFEIIFVLRKNNAELETLENLKKKHSNISVFTFESDATENDMIKKAIQECVGENLVLCRDYFEYATVLSDYIVALGDYGAQVVLYRSKQKVSKVKDFFKRIYNKLVSWIFGFKLYEGDIGLMFFGNIALSVIKELPNSAHYTKVNRFKGFDVSYVESDELPKPKFEHTERKKVVISSIITASISLIFIIGFALLIAFNVLGFLGGLVLMMLIICALFFLTYQLLKLSILNHYGDLS